MIRIFITTLILLGITLTTHAQTAKQAIQATITSEGKACQTVTRAQAIGMIKGTNDALVAAACSDGSRHVLRLHGNKRLSYVSTCGLYENRAGRQVCFQ